MQRSYVADQSHAAHRHGACNQTWPPGFQGSWKPLHRLISPHLHLHNLQLCSSWAQGLQPDSKTWLLPNAQKQA